MPLDMAVGFSPGDFVLDGNPVPSPKRGQGPSPTFSPCLLRPIGWMHQDATWYGGSPGDFVLDGAQLPSRPQRKIRPMSIVAKRLHGSIYALGMEVGLCPEDIVFDVDPAPLSPKRVGALSPIFGPSLLWPNGWMDQDGTWRGGGP